MKVSWGITAQPTLFPSRKPRVRQAPKEISLHMAVAKVLRDHCLPEWQWTHIASGELRDIRTAVKLKRMGVKRGWPDFVLVPPTGQIHCLELKRKGEKLNEDQQLFGGWCISHGVPYFVAYSLNDALVMFDQWHCLRVSMASKGSE